MKEEIINYYRERAKETMEEAEIMFDKLKLIATVNRIYYSMFYEVSALLLTKELSSSKHSGIRSMFNKEFVKSGIIKNELGDFYNKMFELRQRADYEAFVKFDKNKVKDWLKNAKEFINTIDQIIIKLIEDSQ